MKNWILIIALSVPIVSFATTYTTLENGDWGDPNELWSLNGVTPCNCNPGTIVSGDTIILNHDIILQDVGLVLTNGSYMLINATGSLDGSAGVITIQTSEVEAYGDISAKKLMVDYMASLNLYWAELSIVTRMEVNGYVGIHFANLVVDAGNINIFENGVFDLTEGAKLYFEFGNFNNYGVTNLCDECCIELGVGNIKNFTSGVINGGGSMISNNGNIQNEGVWDVLIKWCSQGSDFGMPSPEDCYGANANCSPVPLPVEIVSFDGEAKTGYNQINWVTATELECDYYIVERSLDGENWALVAQVDGSGTTSEESKYTVRDLIEEPNTYYYRLIQFDFNLSQKQAGVITIESLRINNACIYPNPNNGEFTLLMDEVKPGYAVSIFDVNGTQVYEVPDLYGKRIEIKPQLETGVYLLIIDKDGTTETLRFIVK